MSHLQYTKHKNKSGFFSPLKLYTVNNSPVVYKQLKNIVTTLRSHHGNSGKSADFHSKWWVWPTLPDAKKGKAVSCSSSHLYFYVWLPSSSTTMGCCSCSCSGSPGSMLVTVWRRDSICSSVSLSSLSSRICKGQWFSIYQYVLIILLHANFQAP